MILANGKYPQVKCSLNNKWSAINMIKDGQYFVEHDKLP